MKRLLCVMLLLIITLAACSAYFEKTRDKTSPIKIGVVLTLTGPYAEIAGIHHQKGIEIAIHLINERGGINGRQIKAIYEDAISFAPKNILSAYNKLRIQDNADVILMTPYAGFLATAPVAERDEMAIINIFDSSEDIAASGNYAIATGVYDEGIGKSAAAFAREYAHAKKAVVLYNSAEEFLLLASSGFVKEFESLGGRVVMYESYPADTSDFRSTLTKAKSLDFDLLVPMSYDEGGLLVRQAYELGIDAQILGIDTMSTDSFQQNAGSALEGALYTFFEPNESGLLTTLNETFKKIYGKDNDNIWFTSLGYDGINIVAEAIKRGGSTRGRGLIDAIHNLKDFPIVSGKFTLSEDGINRSYTENLLYQIKNGTPELVAKR